MPIDPIREPLRIGYRGQASTIQPSGHDFPRPCGQIKGPQDEAPRLAPTQRLDLALEIGVFIGQPNAQGPRARAPCCLRWRTARVEHMARLGLGPVPERS